MMRKERSASTGTSVLHVAPTLGGGGAERQLGYLCVGLKRLGWRVAVAAIRGGPNASPLSAAQVPVHLLQHASTYDPRLVGQLAILTQRLRPGIVHTWLPMMDILGGLTATMLRVPWVVSEQASRHAYPARIKPVLRKRLVAFSASAVICNSQTGRRYWQEETRRPAAYVVPSGVPVDAIKDVPRVSREALGVAENGEMILFAGRFDAQKNLAVLVAALETVLNMREHAVAVLCGEGPQLDHWRRWVLARGLSRRILLRGYVEPLVAYMKAADVFVSPSLFEGRPNVILEAAASGCPLVISDIPEHREFLDEDTAFFFPPRSSSTLVEALSRALNNPNEAKAKAVRASRVAEEFTTEKMVAGHDRIYRDILRIPQYPS